MRMWSWWHRLCIAVCVLYLWHDHSDRVLEVRRWNCSVYVVPLLWGSKLRMHSKQVGLFWLCAMCVGYVVWPKQCHQLGVYFELNGVLIPSLIWFLFISPTDYIIEHTAYSKRWTTWTALEEIILAIIHVIFCMCMYVCIMFVCTVYVRTSIPMYKYVLNYECLYSI
jgi:hypothetical protein